MTPEEQQAVRDIDPAWEPPRPALDANRNVLRDNNSGQDFRYMHHEMIKMVNGILADVGDPNYPSVYGWTHIPPPGDLDYPVPALDGFERVKSAEFYHDFMAPWQSWYKSPAYLRRATLGQLGADLEWTIHNAMHNRWAAESAVGPRPDTPLAEAVDPRWDDPACDNRDR